MAERVLIVVDEPEERTLLESMVGKAGYKTVSVNCGEAALKAMHATVGTSYDCVVLDLGMAEFDRLGVLGRMQEIGLETPVIVQIASGGIDKVAAAMQAGAFDFVVKPVGFERLAVSLRNAMAARMLAAEIERLKGRSNFGFDFNAYNRRISPQMHATLTPIDDVGAQQPCESIEGRAAIGSTLVLGDDRRSGRFSRFGAPAGGSALNLLNSDGNVRSLADIEADVIRFALVHYGGQMSEVARQLRIGRSTLYRKLEILDWAMPNDTSM